MLLLLLDLEKVHDDVGLWCGAIRECRASCCTIKKRNRELNCVLDLKKL